MNMNVYDSEDGAYDKALRRRKDAPLEALREILLPMKKESPPKRSCIFSSALRPHCEHLKWRTLKLRHVSVIFSKRYKRYVTRLEWQQPSVNTQNTNIDTHDAKLSPGDVQLKVLKLQPLNYKNNWASHAKRINS
ncbi:hypothetical protein PInf_010080 [Phytophthora infestans]|nr:hypothetical protein PInf_010080 [Phytophthora infestans]